MAGVDDAKRYLHWIWESIRPTLLHKVLGRGVNLGMEISQKPGSFVLSPLAFGGRGGGRSSPAPVPFTTENTENTEVSQRPRWREAKKKRAQRALSLLCVHLCALCVLCGSSITAPTGAERMGRAGSFVLSPLALGVGAGAGQAAVRRAARQIVRAIRTEGKAMSGPVGTSLRRRSAAS